MTGPPRRSPLLMDPVIVEFAGAVAEMLLDKRGQSTAIDADLEEFARLLTSLERDMPRQPRPPHHEVPGLRHLPTAIAAAVDAGVCPVLQALRACVGFVRWETFYADSEWSAPFLDDFASGELIGPAGYLYSDTISLGLFVLGPHTLYPEHAHSSTEVYYVLGGHGSITVGSSDNRVRVAPGDVVVTRPDERHELRTDEEPFLIAYSWKGAVDASSYYRSSGPWGNGRVVVPPAKNT